MPSWPFFVDTHLHLKHKAQNAIMALLCWQTPPPETQSTECHHGPSLLTNTSTWNTKHRMPSWPFFVDKHLHLKHKAQNAIMALLCWQTYPPETQSTECHHGPSLLTHTSTWIAGTESTECHHGPTLLTNTSTWNTNHWMPSWPCFVDKHLHLNTNHWMSSWSYFVEKHLHLNTNHWMPSWSCFVDKHLHLNSNHWISECHHGLHFLDKHLHLHHKPQCAVISTWKEKKKKRKEKKDAIMVPTLLTNTST